MDASGAKLRLGAAEWGLLLGLALLWAGSFFFYKVLLTELPPFTVVFGRVLIAAALLWAVVLVRGGRMPSDRRLWRSFAVMGFLNNLVPFSLIVYGETQVSSGLASILNATTPMFTLLVARIALPDERLGGSAFAGLALGACGIVILVGPTAVMRLGGGDAWGDVAVLGAALSYGCAGVYGRRFKGVPSLTVASAQLTASSVLTLPVVVLVDRPWTLPAPGAQTWAALLCLSVFSTALAYLLFFRILARAGAVNVSLVTLLVPCGAVLLGGVALGERLTPSAWAGMAIVALGLLCLDGRPLGWLRGRLRSA